MAVWTKRSVFYHIPKTGGLWVKQAMRNAGVDFGRCKSVSHPFGLNHEHATPETVQEAHKAGRFSFAFVRRPVEWYRSFWAYRARTGVLDPSFPADRCLAGDFEQFVNNCLDAYPGGYVSQLYQFYVGPRGDRLDYVGRQENLADDLIEALTLAGETFDENRVRATAPHNQAAALRERLELSTDTIARISSAEEWVITTFYRREHEPV